MFAGSEGGLLETPRRLESSTMVDEMYLPLRTIVEELVQNSECGVMHMLDLLCIPAVEAALPLPEDSEDGTDPVQQRLQQLQDAIEGSASVDLVGSSVMARPIWGNNGSWMPEDPNMSAGMGMWMDQEMCYANFGGGLGPLPFLGYWDMTQFQDFWNDGNGTGNQKKKDTVKERTVALVTEILETQRNLRHYQDDEGFVAITDMCYLNPKLAEQVFHQPYLVAQAVRSCQTGRVKLDSTCRALRLMTADEIITQAVEGYFRERVSLAERNYDGGEALCEPVLAVQLLEDPEIAHALAGEAAASSADDAAASISGRVARLLEAVENVSELLELDWLEEEGSTIPLEVSCNVAMRPTHELLLKSMEALLESEPRAVGFFEVDGEVPLQWLVDHPEMRHAFRHVGLMTTKASLMAARSALGAARRFSITSSGQSVQRTQRAKVTRRAEPEAQQGRATAFVSNKKIKPSTTMRGIPSHKDATGLRKLLAFYFQPFNLQHNRVLLSLVEDLRRSEAKGKAAKKGSKGHLRALGQRPVFRLQDICALPRVQRTFDRYAPEVASALLAAALQEPGATPVPVRIHHKREAGDPRGSWGLTDPMMELTYVPKLRFVESTDPTRPEVVALTACGPNADQPLAALPSNVCVVVSYSVSSDLSDASSPKAEHLVPRLTEAGVGAESFAWENRQPKIFRQLSLHGPDVICLQGIQSSGFAQRCSESESDNGWFVDEADPANHLVQLYQQLAQGNYGAFFAPTLKLPVGGELCLGNVVFWKRSRYCLQRSQALGTAGACVELGSRQGGPSLVVCSAKSAAVYARDWADAATDEAIVSSFQDAQAALMEWMLEAVSDETQPLFCGDFGVDTRTLVQGLASRPYNSSLPPLAWKSAQASVLGEDAPATCLLADGSCRCSDIILHDTGLEALATFGPFRETPDVLEFFQTGYPSDHILQMALFVRRGMKAEDEEASY